MDIPQLMAGYSGNSSSSLLETLIKPAPIKKKDEGKNLLNVFMDFNLDTKSIDFHLIPYGNQSEKKYNFFGNNPAAAKQIFIVRDVDSILNYWVGRPNGVMKNILDFLENGQLKQLLNECFEKDLFNQNGINLELINYHTINQDIIIHLNREQKGLYLESNKLSPERFINMCIDGGSSSKMALIIPRIIKDNENIVISIHPDYIDAIADSLQGKNEGEKGVCHICSLKKLDINTKEYSSKLSKSSIGKVFVTTTVNYSPLFEKKGHQRNYGICKECYKKLMFGEKRVMNDFKLKIANEDCILLFEGIDNPIDIEYIDEFKKGIDIVFNPKGTKEWIQSFKKELRKNQSVRLYQFNMVFYKTDGKSCAIKKTIENILSVRFEYIRNIFENIRVTFGDLLPQFTLGHLYRIVPVSVAKDGTQLNIQRLLDLYSAIIKAGRVESAFIFDLATECVNVNIKNNKSSKVKTHKYLIVQLQQKLQLYYLFYFLSFVSSKTSFVR